MSTLKMLVAGAALACGALVAFAQTTQTSVSVRAGLGKPIAEADIKQWDIAILPDGTTQMLSYVDRFQFNWMNNYIYAEDAAPVLPKGTVIRITAYILALNKLIDEKAVMDAKTLPQVQMPNRDNFSTPYPDRI